MCPVCLATAALIAGSAASTGGLAAYLFRKLPESRARRDEREDAKGEVSPLSAARSS